MSHWARAFFGIVLGALLMTPCSARDAEQVFAGANAYTVRIDVTISTAFVEDRVGAGHGSGFLVDEKRGWVMTNAHVATYSPSTLEVLAKDGSRVSAHRIYVDPYVDVAIIELEERVPP